MGRDGEQNRSTRFHRRPSADTQRSRTMKKSSRHLALAVAATGLVGLFLLGPAATPAHAQRIINPINFNNRIPVNPNYYISPYMTLGQYAYNTRVLGQAYSYVPPYAL